MVLLSPREELRSMMVRRTIDELEKLVNSCDPLALRNAYIVGKIRTTPAEEEEIRKLITNFTVECDCLKKSSETSRLYRLIEKYPKPREE